MSRTALLLLVASACCLACGPDAEAELDQNARRFPPGFKIKNYRWSGTVVDGGLVEVRNPYGGFRSRSSPDDSVMVTAQIQKLRPDQPDVEFVIQETEAGLIVAVGRAAFDMTELGDGPDTDYPGRIDLTVLVPKHCRLEAQTVDDDIRIEGLTNDVVATARHGNITVVTRGHVRASTGRGNIEVWLGGKSWSQPQSLQTTTGKIVVEMLDFAHLALDARTAGEIRTHFPPGLSQELQREEGALQVVLGRGGSDLLVRSDRGVVELNAVEKLNAKL